jgi:hypothetical protein
MAHSDPVQEAVLGQWGITTLIEESEDPEQALTTFLSKLKAAVSRS